MGFGKLPVATTYRLYLLDPASGGAALQSVIKENGALTSFFLRLKIADKKITEIETIVTRKNESNVFSPEKLTAPDPLWAQVVPASERATREQLIAAANAYFDAIETQGGNYKPAPFAADCNRFENGGQTTNVPGPNGRPPMGCAAQFDAKIFTWIPEVNDRRFPVVDPEHGVVLGIVMFGEPGGQPIPGTDQKRKREATLLAEAFKVTGGQIHRINAVMINRPYHAPTGWNAVLSGSATPSGSTVRVWLLLLAFLEVLHERQHRGALVVVELAVAVLVEHLEHCVNLPDGVRREHFIGQVLERLNLAQELVHILAADIAVQVANVFGGRHHDRQEHQRHFVLGLFAPMNAHRRMRRVVRIVLRVVVGVFQIDARSLRQIDAACDSDRRSAS